MPDYVSLTIPVAIFVQPVCEGYSVVQVISLQCLLSSGELWAEWAGNPTQTSVGRGGEGGQEVDLQNKSLLTQHIAQA